MEKLNYWLKLIEEDTGNKKYNDNCKFIFFQSIEFSFNDVPTNLKEMIDK